MRDEKRDEQPLSTESKDKIRGVKQATPIYMSKLRATQLQYKDLLRGTNKIMSTG